MNDEVKWHDAAMFQSNPTDSRVWSTVIFISEGKGETKRIGRDNTEMDRMAVPHRFGHSIRRDRTQRRQHTVYGHTRQTMQRAVPGIAEILQATSGAPTIVNFVNLNNEGRFEILMDKMHNLRYCGISELEAGTTTQAGTTEHFQWSARVNIKIHYSGASGDTPNITSNNILFVMITKGVKLTSQGTAEFVSPITNKSVPHFTEKLFHFWFVDLFNYQHGKRAQMARHQSQ